MTKRNVKIFTPLLVGLFVVATSQMASAKPFFGSGCGNLGCHTTAGGNLSTAPDPLEIGVDDTGTVTFDILANPDKGAIALFGLDDTDLDVTLGSGWTVASGYAYSNVISGTPTYDLDLTTSASSVQGLYGIGVIFAGKGGGEWLSTYDFSVDVVPEPGMFVLLLSGGALCLAGLRRRRTA